MLSLTGKMPQRAYRQLYGADSPDPAQIKPTINPDHSFFITRISAPSQKNER